jgi:hypothetical protein
MNDGLYRTRKEVVVSYSRYYLGIGLEGLRKSESQMGFEPSTSLERYANPSSSNNIMAIKLRRMWWTGHIECVGM